MSSSDEAYHTARNVPDIPSEHSPEHTLEHSPEKSLEPSPEHPPEHSPQRLLGRSSENSPAELAEPYAGDIESMNERNPFREYAHLEAYRRLVLHSKPTPRYYPAYNLDFASATAPETAPTTIVFNWAFPGPDATPASPTFLMEASSFFKDRQLAMPDSAAKYGLWIGDQPRETMTTIPAGSWVFFPLIRPES